MSNVILYFDETGSRFPDHEPAAARDDRMNCFGFGGILFSSEVTGQIFKLHSRFCQKWNISYPLHSNEIRAEKGKFSWLGRVPTATKQIFHQDLAKLIESLPILVVACIVDRQGYNKRYLEVYAERRWMLCRTAFAILLERSAKFVDLNARRLEVYFEQSGKREDRDIVGYQRALKHDGMPFDIANSAKYAPFSAADFRRTVVGEPKRRSKSVPMCQIADLVLYPVAKGGYVPEYRPFCHLRDCGKLIDCQLPAQRVEELGVKYFCFD